MATTASGNEVTVRTYPIIACTLLLLLGCQKAPAQPASNAAGSGTPPVQTPAPATPPGGAAPAAVPQGTPERPAVKPVPEQLPEVLARVNGEAITKDELEAAVKNLEQRVGRPVPPGERDAVLRGMLDQLVAFHILKQEIKARQITVPESELDARIGQLRQQFKSEDEFKQALASRNVTVESLKADARDELAITRMVEAEVNPKIGTIDETAVKTFYDKNASQFQQPEAWRASHILIRTESGATDVQKKEARAKAESILKEIRGGGDFAGLAKQHSQDASAPSGGDLNFFQKGQMVPQFEQAVAALKPGEVSDVVETQFGYHIIRLTEHRDARQVPLAEAAPRISEYLRMQAQQQKAGEFIEALKAKSKIEILI